MGQPQQLVFIDDSGDPGFKKGASRMFIIACVIFSSPDAAEFASAKIKALKNKLGWKQNREFKFHRASEEQKRIFFKTIKHFDFTISAIVVDKTRITEPQLKKSDSFYNFIITAVLEKFADLNEGIVRLDGSGSKDFRRRSTSNLRKKLNADGRRKIKRFILEDSRDQPLIQLADMIAGSIRVKYDPDKTIKKDYLRLIENKIDNIELYQ